MPGWRRPRRSRRCTSLDRSTAHRRPSSRGVGLSSPEPQTGTQPQYEQLLSGDEVRGDERALAMEPYNLASVLLQTCELDRARSHLQRSLELCPTKPEQLRYTVLGYAGWLARADDPHTAGQVLGAVENHLEMIGEILDPAAAVELASHVTAGRARDAAAFESGRRAGRVLTLADAQAFVV